MKRYAGIGSRNTPPVFLIKMAQLGKGLAETGWLLRSGGANGADSNFEWGCDEARGLKEIILPWRRFNTNQSELVFPSFGRVHDEAMRIASELHPGWDRCKVPVKLLHARNVLQVLGMNLQEPVDLVLCWTPDGKPIGGTAMAINVAMSRKIPVWNMGDPQLPNIIGLGEYYELIRGVLFPNAETR